MVATSTGTAMTGPRIGLALSGGGYRATAFGLGCLRALHDLGLLSQITVVSGISGGSLLAAMWAYGPASFREFDDTVTALLRHDLQRELLRRALRPHALLRGGVSTARALPGAPARRPQRSFTRTELLAQAVAARAFGIRTMEQVTHPGLDTVLSATDLATGNAVRFGSARSSCSPYGRILDAVPVADAVTASAAFPLALSALTRTYRFQDSTGQHQRTVSLTDGGVYDNLGLSPLLPGRSPRFTSHVYELDYVIAADAGRGRDVKPPASFWIGRVARSFDITYAKSQDGSRTQLHAAAEHRQLRGFVHAYLATPDHKLPAPVADLVPRSDVVSYPTNFAAMTEENLYRLTTRGEQLVRLLLPSYCPALTSR